MPHPPLRLLALVTLALLAAATPAHAAEVRGDDERDVFVGTGTGLLLDSTFTGPSAARQRAATCAGCRWSLTIACGGSESSTCLDDSAACPPDHRRVAVWFAEAGEPLAVRGTTCLGPRGPRTVADVASEVEDLVLTAVPPLRPAIRPDPVLAGVPARIITGQPAALGARTLHLAGAVVVLDAACRWTWDWGDGTTRSTNATVLTHAWRRAGRPVVRVESSWTGWFTVDGLGPFAVGGSTIRQQAVLRPEVRPARAVLVRRDGP